MKSIPSLLCLSLVVLAGPACRAQSPAPPSSGAPYDTTKTQQDFAGSWAGAICVAPQEGQPATEPEFFQLTIDSTGAATLVVAERAGSSFTAHVTMPSPGTLSAVFGDPTSTTLAFELGFSAPSLLKGHSWFNGANGTKTSQSPVIAMRLDGTFQDFQTKQTNICR